MNRHATALNLPLIAVITGSDSDLPFIKPTIETLDQLIIPYKLVIASAHRTPEKLRSFLHSIESSIQVIIAVAGGAAHLPGVVAGETLLPVIGLPVPTSFLNGLDSLLSINQMPKGVPVATVTCGGAGPMNAALLAGRILSLTTVSIKERMIAFTGYQAEEVLKKDEKLQKKGYLRYLHDELDYKDK